MPRHMMSRVVRHVRRTQSGARREAALAPVAGFSTSCSSRGLTAGPDGILAPIGRFFILHTEGMAGIQAPPNFARATDLPTGDPAGSIEALRADSNRPRDFRAAASKHHGGFLVLGDHAGEENPWRRVGAEAFEAKLRNHFLVQDQKLGEHLVRVQAGAGIEIDAGDMAAEKRKVHRLSDEWFSAVRLLSSVWSAKARGQPKVGRTF